jgi:DDE superfamily endonuclease
MRLRIRTQRHGQSVHDVRPARRLAARQSHHRRTAVDYAQALEDLSDRHFPNAKKIVLVQDNLNTHKPASLYEAFPAYKARRLVERFEWHYTPKHGSWLDMAESELAVLASQCLDRRIPDKQILIQQVAAWEADRNAHHAKADWQFTTDDARIKLKGTSKNIPLWCDDRRSSSQRGRSFNP